MIIDWLYHSTATEVNEEKMPKSSKPAVLVISVTTSTGQVIQHAYPAPNTTEGVADLISRTTTRIDDAFNPSTPKGFILENPVVIYNLDHVVSIKVDGLSEHQLTNLAQITEKRLGFNNA